jgi:hypothetical protein
LRGCLFGVRAEPFACDSDEFTALEVFLMQIAAGMEIETRRCGHRQGRGESERRPARPFAARSFADLPDLSHGSERASCKVPATAAARGNRRVTGRPASCVAVSRRLILCRSAALERRA